MTEHQNGSAPCPTDAMHLLPSPFVRVDRLSSGRAETAAEQGAIIQADNVRALASLLDSHRGQIRCIYIDPPYNNNEQYRYYDDKGSHHDWKASLEARLRLMWPLLSETGSLWISIDDQEVHYLKVAADQLFGRDRFVTTIIWQMRTTRENRKVFSNNHEYILVYAKNPKAFKRARNKLPPTEQLLARYKNPDDDPRGPWQSISANVQGGHGTASQMYELIAPNGKRHWPPEGRCWVYAQEKMRAEIDAGNIWFGRSGDNVPRIKKFLHDASPGLTPDTLWSADAAGTNDQAKKHLLGLLPETPIFDTPKPEALLREVLHIASDPGDLILDAYAGSGTTAAVAHKMGRRYLIIEQGEQAETVCVPRLREVIGGEGGGISAEVGWAGGGRFGFYQLDPGAGA